MGSEDDMKKNFNENLKAIEYHKELNDNLKRITIYYELTSSFIYDVVKSRRFEGEKLLEIGSGATVHNIASASAYFPIIVQSEFVEDNREALKDWLKGNSPLDWSDFLSMPARLEDFKGDVHEVVAKLEDRIRSRVKAVVHADILTDGVLNLDEIPDEATPPYDLIISILCLEVPCANFGSFVDVLKRLNKLLRKGGGIIMSSFIDCDKWIVGTKEFPNLKISMKNILKAMDMAGFGNHDVKSFSPLNSTNPPPYGGFYYLVSEKL